MRFPSKRRHGPIAVVLSSLLVSAGVAAAQGHGPHAEDGGRGAPVWQRNAERTFCLGSGQGRALLTQEEWQEHREMLRGLSAEESARYRDEWHRKMVERARERGVELRAGPCPRGAGTGPGKGSGPKGAGGAR